MGWDVVFRILGSVLFSVGGAGVIIWAFSSWLGKVWANRILEGDRAKYSREIESIKKNFNKELTYYKSQLELARTALSRYSESQFHLYSKLWNFLCDLKITGDKLWEEVTAGNILHFSEQLQKTKDYVMKSALLIEDNHYIQLMKLLDSFGNYEIRKKKLSQLRRQRSNMSLLAEALLEHNIIQDNQAEKESYDKLLSSIKESFKKRLKGDFAEIKSQ